MILFLLCGVILSLLVLIQRGRGGGLAGAFGGAGGSAAFGTKTADIFVKATAVVGGIFFLLAIITALLMRSSTAPAPAPTQTETPAPATPGAQESTGGENPETPTPEPTKPQL